MPRPKPFSHATSQLGKCHAGLTFYDGSWLLEISIQYWTVASVEISAAEAAKILARYETVKLALAEDHNG